MWWSYVICSCGEIITQPLFSQERHSPFIFNSPLFVVIWMGAFPAMFLFATFGGPLTAPSTVRRSPAHLGGYAPSSWLSSGLGTGSPLLLVTLIHFPASHPASRNTWMYSEYRSIDFLIQGHFPPCTLESCPNSPPPVVVLCRVSDCKLLGAGTCKTTINIFGTERKKSDLYHIAGKRASRSLAT